MSLSTISDEHLDFVDRNIGRDGYPRLLEVFDLSDQVGPARVRLCPDGGCHLAVELLGEGVVRIPPDSVHVSLGVSFRSVDSSGDPIPFPMEVDLGLTSECEVDVDTRSSGAPHPLVAWTARFSIDPVTQTGHLDVSRPYIPEEFEDRVFAVEGGAQCFLSDWIRTSVTDMLVEGLASSLQDYLPEAFCLAPEGDR